MSDDIGCTWEVAVTSTEAGLIERLSEAGADLAIEVGSVEYFPGATDTVLQILGLIRDVDLSVFCSLTAKWLWQSVVTSPGPKPQSQATEHSMPSATAATESRSTRVHVTVRDVSRSIEVDVNVEADSALEVEAILAETLRSAGLGG